MEHLVQVLQQLEVKAQIVGRLDLPIWSPDTAHDHSRDAIIAIAALLPLAVIS